MSPPALRTLARLGLRLALAAAAAFLLLEGLVRGILFRGWLTALEPIAALRRPDAFACRSEDELQHLIRRLGDRRTPPNEYHDPELGWRPPQVGPAYAHWRRLALGSQRPVLLFGDSYAQGVPPSQSFQELFEGTGLGASMELLNYGAGGYGLDQIQMLAERALEHWRAHDPVVIVGLLVDDDLDRCRLSIHPWPKPRYRLVGGRPVLERERVPTLDEHMRRAFPLAESWAWRLLLHGGALPDGLARKLCGDAAADRAVRPLAEALLERLIADLRARRMAFGFLLFYDLPSVEDPGVLGWREELVRAVLDRERAPYAVTREALARHMAASGRPGGDYYHLEGRYRGHLTTLGNQVALEELVELVERLTAGAAPYAPPPAALSLAGFASSAPADEQGRVHYFEDRARLSLRAGRAGPTEVRYAVGAATRLAFEAWSPPGEPGAVAAPAGEGAELRVLVDGRELAAVRVAPGAAPRSVELDVAGARELVIRLANLGPHPWQVVHLEDGVAR